MYRYNNFTRGNGEIIVELEAAALTRKACACVDSEMCECFGNGPNIILCRGAQRENAIRSYYH